MLLSKRPEQIFTEAFSNLLENEASLQFMKCSSLEIITLYKIIPAIIAYAGTSSHWHPHLEAKPAGKCPDRNGLCGTQRVCLRLCMVGLRSQRALLGVTLTRAHSQTNQFKMSEGHSACTNYASSPADSFLWDECGMQNDTVPWRIDLGSLAM